MKIFCTCMFVSLHHVFVCECMCICRSICLSAWLSDWLIDCLSVCLPDCMHSFVCTRMHALTRTQICVCESTCMCVYMSNQCCCRTRCTHTCWAQLPIQVQMCFESQRVCVLWFLVWGYSIGPGPGSISLGPEPTIWRGKTLVQCCFKYRFLIHHTINVATSQPVTAGMPRIFICSHFITETKKRGCCFFSFWEMEEGEKHIDLKICHTWYKHDSHLGLLIALLQIPS